MSETYDNIESYFNIIQGFFLNFQALIASIEVKYETRTKEEGSISGLVKFIDRSELHIREYLFIKHGALVRSTYRFHWQDSKK